MHVSHMHILFPKRHILAFSTPRTRAQLLPATGGCLTTPSQRYDNIRLPAHAVESKLLAEIDSVLGRERWGRGRGEPGRCRD